MRYAPIPDLPGRSIDHTATGLCSLVHSSSLSGKYFLILGRGVSHESGAVAIPGFRHTIRWDVLGDPCHLLQDFRTETDHVGEGTGLHQSRFGACLPIHS